MDFSHLTILCAGDAMLDRFVHGDIDRISPEAPVPVLRLRETREMPGGAGNVACNIASLGGRAILVGLIGADEAGARLSRILEGKAGIEAALVVTARRPTICKTRFIAGRQQVVRADDESGAPLFEEEATALMAAIDAQLPRCQALVLSDYGKSVLSQQVVAYAIEAAKAAGIPVFVDPKSPDFTRYRGATCITPNLKEFSAAAGEICTTEAQIVGAAHRLLDAAEARAILVTRSERGMILVEAGDEVTSVPARAREVFDVSGAGDTVIATLGLMLAAGVSMSDAMRIANRAAGVVVGKLGTSTVTRNELLAAL